MAYALGYRDEDVVAPLCLPQVWSTEPRSLFVEPPKVWGDIMYEGQRRDENKPVWGRGERRRAAEACSRARGMPVNRGLMQRIWAARRTIRTLGFRRRKVLCSVQVSDNLRELFKRQREREAPGEAAAQGPEVWVTVPSGVPIQTPGAQDNKRNSQVRGQANSRQEMVRSSSSQRRPRPSRGPGKSGIHGVLRTLFGESQEPGRDRWLAEPYQCHQGGCVARRWRWRKVLRGEPVPEGWGDLNGETGRAMANQDPNENDPGLYPVAQSSDSGVRVVLGDEGAGSEMKVSGVLESVVGLGLGLHYKGGVFVTIMAELTWHFVWMAIKLACAEALLVHRLWIVLLRWTSVCEDFKLDEPMAVCLMAVRCLSPDAWESLNHLSTSPKPKLARVTPEILAAGIGEVGCYQMTEREWDENVPPRFLRFMEIFDLREMPKGNGRVRKPVLGMTDAIRRTGVLHDEDPSMTPTCFPFVIPKNSVKCSLILSCVGIHEGLPLKPPKFSLASWELIGWWVAEQDPSRELYGTHVDLSNAFWSFKLPRKASRIFRFYTRQGGGLVSLDRLPFEWAFSPFICQQLLGRVVRGIVPEGVYSVHFLDDFILLSCDRDLLEGVTETVAARIRQAGFLVSSKSTLSPVPEASIFRLSQPGFRACPRVKPPPPPSPRPLSCNAQIHVARVVLLSHHRACRIVTCRVSSACHGRYPDSRDDTGRLKCPLCHRTTFFYSRM